MQKESEGSYSRFWLSRRLSHCYRLWVKDANAKDSFENHESEARRPEINSNDFGRFGIIYQIRNSNFVVVEIISK